MNTTWTTAAAGTFGALAGAGVIAEATSLPLLFAILLVGAGVAVSFATFVLTTALLSPARRPLSVRRRARAHA